MKSLIFTLRNIVLLKLYSELALWVGHCMSIRDLGFSPTYTQVSFITPDSIKSFL